MATSHDYYSEMTEIYKHLQDEESKILFKARISYALNKNADDYVKTIHKLYHDWHSLELEKAMNTAQGIIIFGCGNIGIKTNKLLGFWGYETSYFCDNYKYGQIVDGKKVLSVDEVIENYRDYLVVIGSTQYGKDMYVELVQKGFSYTNIFLPKYQVIGVSRGKQYFDLFESQLDEVYVDAGTFDGKTVLDFCQWANGKYKKIYAFEPMSNMCNVIQQKMEKENITEIEILNYAAWNKREEIYFVEGGAGSHVNDNDGIAVQGLDIDSAVKDEKVTYIKMDIEGSELNALKGAKNTIINNRPRLAICIYHKPMDVIELASYILELVPEYKLYIRHYASNMWETVLYAVP